MKASINCGSCKNWKPTEESSGVKGVCNITKQIHSPNGMKGCLAWEEAIKETE